MRSYALGHLIFPLLMGLTPGPGPDPAPENARLKRMDKAALKKLQGEWRSSTITIVISGTRMKHAVRGEDASEWRLILDASEPRISFKLKWLAGPDEGWVGHGSYSFTSDGSLLLYYGFKQAKGPPILCGGNPRLVIFKRHQR